MNLMETSNGIVEQIDAPGREEAPFTATGAGEIKDTRAYIMQLLLNWDCGRDRLFCPLKGLRMITDKELLASIINDLPEKAARKILREHFICSMADL